MGKGQKIIFSTREIASDWDLVQLPDGRRVRDVSRDELARILLGLGVRGVSLSNGKQANTAFYAEYRATIVQEAGEKAVAALVGGQP